MIEDSILSGNDQITGKTFYPSLVPSAGRDGERGHLAPVVY